MGGWYKEGKAREEIASYFLQVPPPDKQTPWQRHRTRRVLRRLWRVETNSVLRCAGQSRRLQQGDALALITAVLNSAAVLTGRESGRIGVIVPVKPTSAVTAVEPRLLQLGVVALLRDNLRRSRITAEVTLQTAGLTLRLHTEKAFVCRRRTLRLVNETARLHGGSLAVDRCGIVLHLRLNAPGEGDFSVPPLYALTHSPTAVPVMGLWPLIPDRLKQTR